LKQYKINYGRNIKTTSILSWIR